MLKIGFVKLAERETIRSSFCHEGSWGSAMLECVRTENLFATNDLAYNLNLRNPEERDYAYYKWMVFLGRNVVD